MIFDKAPVFEAPRPVIAYAVTENGRLLYADPPARAAREAAALSWKEGAVTESRRVAFSVGERELSLSLLRLGGEDTPASAQALLRAEDGFRAFLSALKHASEEPPDAVMLPHTLATLRGELGERVGKHIFFSPLPRQKALPVCVRGRVLFLSLGIAASVMAPFGQISVSLDAEDACYRLRLTAENGSMPEFPACLLTRVAARGGYRLEMLPDGVLFEMRATMTAIVLREEDGRLVRAFSLGMEAMGARLPS